MDYQGLSCKTQSFKFCNEVLVKTVLLIARSLLFAFLFSICTCAVVDKTDGSAHTTTREDVTENGSGSMVPATSSDLSRVCSQQLKNLARQLQVSSSFRVEKKIGQAIEELGLFPITLYLNHLSHRPDKPLLHFPEKVNAILPFRKFLL